MEITEKLIITVKNQNDFKKLKKCKAIVVGENTNFSAPHLTHSGNIDLEENANFSAPHLISSGDIYLRENANFAAPHLISSGYIHLREDTNFSAPHLTHSDDIYLAENANFAAPHLTRSGNIHLREDTNFSAPHLTRSGKIHLREDTNFAAPHLISSGDIYLRENANFAAPHLTRSGYIHLRENANFAAPHLISSGNIDLEENANFDCKLTKNLNYKSVDNKMFVIKSEIVTKGIKIYSGYNLVSIKNKKIQKEKCYVAEKGNKYAHGGTVKKAIVDVQFKVIAEKLKKDPIYPETVISIQYYRIITGACEFGCKSWVEQNNIKTDRMKASELLPLLEKTQAYGVDRFKSLANWTD